MSSPNYLKINLMQFRKRVETFKGRDALEELVQKRLDKSLDLYIKSLEEAYQYGLDITPTYALKKLKK